jgi:hypothetical protein
MDKFHLANLVLSLATGGTAFILVFTQILATPSSPSQLGSATQVLTNHTIRRPKYVFHVEDYQVPATDCDNTGCDWTPAFERLMDDQECSPESNKRQGCKVQLGCNTTYELRSGPIEVCRQMVFEGCGGAGWGASTIIKTVAGIDAFRLHSNCLSSDGGAGWTVIRDLAILGTSLNEIDPERPTYGLHAEARFKAENLWISGFTQGIRISADVNRTPATNANNFAIDYVRIDANAHAGIYVDGGDTNAGYGIGVDSSSNCQRAEGHQCANIYDSSFLGNTWVAAHTATAKNGQTGKAFPGYIFEGLNARSMCVNCYAEMDQEPSQVDQNSMVIGGLLMSEGAGYIQQGPQVNRLAAINDYDPNNKVKICLGNCGSPGAFYELQADAGVPAWPLRAKYDSATHSYLYDIANLDAAVSLRIKALSDDSPGWAPSTPIGSVKLKGNND